MLMSFSTEEGFTSALLALPLFTSPFLLGDDGAVTVDPVDV